MLPFRNRFKSIFGIPDNQQMPNTNYDITNEFLTKILPLIQSGRLADENRGRIDATQQGMFPLNRALVGREEPIIDMGKFMPESKPINVNYAGLNPYQEGLLRLREQELALNKEKFTTKSDIDQQRADAYTFKSQNPNLVFKDNGMGKMQAFNPITGDIVNEWDSGSFSEEDSIRLKQRGALENIAATSRGRINQIERQGEIESRHIGERGEEARETKQTIPGKAPGDAEPRPLLPSQQRIKTLENARKAYNEHPEWQEFIVIDGNSFLIKSSGDPKTDESIRNAVYKKSDINLPNEKVETKSDETKEEPPPKGAKPGGKWVVTKSGRKVYMEPD